MATHDDDRAAYLAGEGRLSLTADERAELDELRGVLGSPALWTEPSADLEDRVVRAFAADSVSRRASVRERSRSLRLGGRWHWARPVPALGGLAAAAGVAAVAVVLATNGRSPAPVQFAMV